MCSDNEIEVGDLVCLADDEDYMIGIGIVIDIASDNDSYLDDFFGPINIDYDSIIDDDEELERKLYLHRPVYLVLWSGDKNYFSDDPTTRPLWFFKNELKLVNKANKN
tara:strand:+ start:479 stop:802 length:324 start_codon:yes stop_codon:yes gene_type:complete